jgi:hypothetical protein
MAAHRSGAGDIALSDALRSALAMFSLHAPSLRALDTERTADTGPRVSGLERVPCATALREILDPVDPPSLRPLFTGGGGALQRGKALEELVFVAGHSLCALDGTGSVAAPQLHCASCVETPHRTGTSRHQMLGAALIPPDRRAVMPLRPEPLLPQDGPETNDCARKAAKRFMVRLRQAPPISSGWSPQTA